MSTVDVHSRTKVVNFILGYSEKIDKIVKARRARKARFAKKTTVVKVDETAHFRS